MHEVELSCLRHSLQNARVPDSRATILGAISSRAPVRHARAAEIAAIAGSAVINLLSPNEPPGLIRYMGIWWVWLSGRLSKSRSSDMESLVAATGRGRSIP